MRAGRRPFLPVTSQHLEPAGLELELGHALAHVRRDHGGPNAVDLREHGQQALEQRLHDLAGRRARLENEPPAVEDLHVAQVRLGAMQDRHVGVWGTIALGLGAHSMRTRTHARNTNLLLVEEAKGEGRRGRRSVGAGRGPALFETLRRVRRRNPRPRVSDVGSAPAARAATPTSIHWLNSSGLRSL